MFCDPLRQSGRDSGKGNGDESGMGMGLGNRSLGLGSLGPGVWDCLTMMMIEAVRKLSSNKGPLLLLCVCCLHLSRPGES